MASTSGTSVLPPPPPVPARGVEHLDERGGHGGLAVGAGDRQQRRPVVPRAGQVELAAAPGTTAAPAAAMHGVASGTPGLGTTASRAATSAPLPRRRRLVQVDVQLPRPGPFGAGAVVDHGDGYRRATAARGRGLPGDRQAVDEGALALASSAPRDAGEVRVVDAEGQGHEEPARIQKRMITVVSGQPISSKWWWIGAMRKMRRWPK